MVTPVYDLYREHKNKADAIQRKAGDYAAMFIGDLMQKMSLRQIARRVKRSPTYISQVLNRRSICSMETFKALDELYNKEQKR